MLPGEKETIGFLNVNHRNRTASFCIHTVVDTNVTIVGMQYNHYKDTYRALHGSHVYDLLRIDNNGKIPRLLPDYDNQYDNQAVYLGVQNFKYGYAAKKSFDHNTSSEEIRLLLHTDEFKDGLIESVVTRVNTDNVVYRKNESVTAHVVLYLKHPLYDVEKSFDVRLDMGADKIKEPYIDDNFYINSSGKRTKRTPQESELKRAFTLLDATTDQNNYRKGQYNNNCYQHMSYDEAADWIL